MQGAAHARRRLLLTAYLRERPVGLLDLIIPHFRAHTKHLHAHCTLAGKTSRLEAHEPAAGAHLIAGAAAAITLLVPLPATDHPNQRNRQRGAHTK